MHITVNQSDQVTGIYSLPQEGSVEVGDDDPRVLDYFRAEAKVAIDRAAGACRSRFVSAGEYLSAEYELADQEARAFADAEYAGQVPGTVQAHVDALGGTAQEAADSIIATGELWRAILKAIRAVRLNSKAAVDDCSTQAEMEATVAQAISAFEAIGT